MLNNMSVLGKTQTCSHEQRAFVYLILKELHTWDLTTDVSNQYRRCLRSVYETGSYTERDRFILDKVREIYVERKRAEYEK